MKDIFGKSLVKNDYIVYATVFGRSATVKFGRIVGFASSGKPLVASVERSWWMGEAKFKKCERLGTVQCEERVMKISPFMLPDKIVFLINSGFGETATLP